MSNLKIEEKKSKVNMQSALMVGQMTLLVELLSFLVLGYFVPEAWIIFQIMLVLFAFVAAFNNHKIYKRSMFTLIYVVFGLIVLATIFI